MNILKRFISFLLITLIISDNFSVITFASGLQRSYFYINDNGADSVSFSIGDTFSLDAEFINDAGEPITNVMGYVAFSSPGFSYGEEQLTRISGQNILNPIPLSDWNNTNSLSFHISDNAGEQIPNGATFGIYKLSNDYWGFNITPDIQTYQNNVTVHFEAQKTSDSSNIVGETYTKTIYVNVKPHIIDYYFEKQDGSSTVNQVQGSNAQAINFVMKVKDYNSCSNIDGGTVTADLSQLGLSSNETLNYASCGTDGKTAIFKKTGIVTNAAIGTYYFSAFKAIDENGNENSPTDPNTTFSSEDKTSPLSLTVIEATSPIVKIQNISDNYIGSSSEQTSGITFSGSKSGEIKISLGSDGFCNGGTILKDWTGSGSYLANTLTGITVNSSSLSEGTNSIYTCVRNSSGEIGSDLANITKDTSNPIASQVVISPASVTTQNSSFSYLCNEGGTYIVENGGNGTIGSGSGIVGPSSVQANIAIAGSIGNSTLLAGSNTIFLYCKDNAGNIGYATGAVTKVAPTPTMSGQVVSFSDSDINYDGLDGRDLSFSWNATTYSNFESYRLFLLPSNVSWSSSMQNKYIKLITDKTVSSWTGDNKITKDSTDTNLVSGGSYKMCIQIMSTSGELGGIGCSAATTLLADTVSHPTILGARFIQDDKLEITTDATLTGTLASHSGSLISYVFGGITHSGTAISSVSSTKLVVTIPSLGNTQATGSSLIVLTGAINANGGGYNNYFSSGTLIITDGQTPVISGFATGSASQYVGFYSGSLNFSYSLSEQLKAGGSSYIKFSRYAGNSSSDFTYSITDTTKLTQGAHTITIDLAQLGLVSGAYYNVQFIGTDNSGNIGYSSTIAGIKFDKTGPAMVTVSPVGSVGVTSPTLSWLMTSDDFGNGSGVKGYILKIYSSAGCSTPISTQNITNPSTLQQQISLADLQNYSWTITPYDNLGNIGPSSSCDSFTINTLVPSFSSYYIKDKTLSSTSYSKGGNDIEISSTITSTDINHIWLDASILKDSSYSNISCASPGISGVTCTFSSQVAKYTFAGGFLPTASSGVKQVRITSSNSAGINTGSVLTSITLDNSAPTISGSPITSPVGSSVFGGNSKAITWSTSSIYDNIAISYLKFEYSANGGTSWNLIGTGSNTSPYTWNLNGISDGSNYKIRITAVDIVGNSTSTTSDIFTVDKTYPTVSSSTIISPNGGNVLKGGSNVSISWNTDSSHISDNLGLASNPISLYYSADGGTNWSTIALGIANTSPYAFSVPSINSNQVKIRLVASDSAGNTGSDISDNTFIIDSVKPSLNVSFAGNGGMTPQNGKYINGSTIDISAQATDNYMAKVYFSLEDMTDGMFWQSGNTWGFESPTTICTDTVPAGTSTTCNAFSTNINPTPIADGHSYRLKISAIDEGGNITNANPIDYIGDTIAPNLSLNTASGSYFSGSIAISGTASDTGSNLSSVTIEIKKGSSYWNGSSWVVAKQELSTSGTVTNWSYTFDPALDVDGTNYQVTVNAYDQAFKTPNKKSYSIYITKDTSGPYLDKNIFTFPISGVKKGGTTQVITWNTTGITGSGASFSGINLEYNLDGNIITLASGLPNSGTYSFQLPLVDSSIKIILTAYDTIGNLSNPVSSSDILIDSTPPQISKVETIGDTTGKLGGLNIYFSEKVNISSGSYSDFSVSGATISSVFSTIEVGTGTVMHLNFTTPVFDTSTTPSLIYSAGQQNITDIAGNKAGAKTIIAIDKAEPIATKFETLDSNSNGKLDSIKVYFSENLAATNTLNGISLSNTYPGMSLKSASIGANSNYMTIGLNESLNYDTSISGGLQISLNNQNYTDTQGNLAGNFSAISPEDKASPILTSLATASSGNNGDVDRVYATFSESLTGGISGFNLVGFGTAVNSKTLSGSVIIFALDSSKTQTSQTGALDYTAGLATDAVGNILATISGAPVQDQVGPKILNSETFDSDGNGKIDKILVYASENISGTIGNITIGSGSYVVLSKSASGSVAILNIEEKGTEDSGISPSMSLITGSLSDNYSNQSYTWSGSATDKVGPVISGAVLNGNTIFINASENLDAASINASSFSFSGVSPSGITDVSVNGNNIILTLSSAMTQGGYISFTSNSVKDSLGNTQSTNHYVKISDPVIINEVMRGDSYNSYIELKNIGTSPITLDSIIIENAGITINGNVTIPSGGLYLISDPRSTIISGATPDNLSNIDITGDISLKDSLGNTYDQAPASLWSYTSGTVRSHERKANPGYGMDTVNWYSAVASINLSSQTIKGTPGSANVYDSISPTITSSSLNEGDIWATGTGIVTYNYSDNIEINPSTATLKLNKCTTSNCYDITSTGVILVGATQSGGSFNIGTLPYGRYQAIFEIRDTSGNPISSETNFYVDEMSLNITSNNANIGAIIPGTGIKYASDITITVNTIGTDFDLKIGGDSILAGPGGGIGSYDSGSTRGFGFDYLEQEGSTILKSFSGLSAITGSSIGTHSRLPDQDGNLKTYTYVLRYGASVPNSQASGNYLGTTNYTISLSYD